MFISLIGWSVGRLLTRLTRPPGLDCPYRTEAGPWISSAPLEKIGIGRAEWRQLQAIEIDVGLEAANDQILVGIVRGGSVWLGHDTRGVPERLVHGLRFLVIELLTRDDRDGLRRLQQRCIGFRSRHASRGDISRDGAGRALDGRWRWRGIRGNRKIALLAVLLTKICGVSRLRLRAQGRGSPFLRLWCVNRDRRKRRLRARLKIEVQRNSEITDQAHTSETNRTLCQTHPRAQLNFCFPPVVSGVAMRAWQLRSFGFARI